MYMCVCVCVFDHQSPSPSKHDGCFGDHVTPLETKRGVQRGVHGWRPIIIPQQVVTNTYFKPPSTST